MRQGADIATDIDLELRRFGKELQRSREDAGIEQADAAERAGISRVSLSRYENGRQRAPHDVVLRLKAIYAGQPAHRVAEPGVGYDPRGTFADAWAPNPTLRNKIPPRAYEAAIEYCRRLQRAGLPRESIEEVERLMIDSRYAQANKRQGRELSEDEWIMLIDATWEAVREAASWDGVRV